MWPKPFWTSTPPRSTTTQLGLSTFKAVDPTLHNGWRSGGVRHQQWIECDAHPLPQRQRHVVVRFPGQPSSAVLVRHEYVGALALLASNPEEGFIPEATTPTSCRIGQQGVCASSDLLRGQYRGGPDRAQSAACGARGVRFLTNPFPPKSSCASQSGRRRAGSHTRR